VKQLTGSCFVLAGRIFLLLSGTEPGNGKITVVVYDRPGGLSARIDAMGAQLVARLPCTHDELHDELPGAAEILIHGINPVAICIPGGQTEQAFTQQSCMAMLSKIS